MSRLKLPKWIRETSLEVFNELVRDGTFSQREAEVYIALNHLQEATDREITTYMGKSDPNYVRPRRKELVDQNLIIEAGKRKCRITNMTSLVWRCNKLNERKPPKKVTLCPFCKGTGNFLEINYTP